MQITLILALVLQAFTPTHSLKTRDRVTIECQVIGETASHTMIVIGSGDTVNVPFTEIFELNRLVEEEPKRFKARGTGASGSVAKQPTHDQLEKILPKKIDPTWYYKIGVGQHSPLCPKILIHIGRMQGISLLKWDEAQNSFDLEQE